MHQQVLKSVLVTGSNRGLGLEIVRQLVVGHPSFGGGAPHIFACCRTGADEPNATADLRRIQEENNGGAKVHILKMEVTDDKQIEDAVKFVRSVVGDDGLNLLINNAGFLQSDRSLIPKVDRQNFLRHMDVNAAGPIMITQAFLPLLRLAAAKNTGNGDDDEKKLSIFRAAVVNISSGAGSIGTCLPCNTRTGLGYRVSKAALNMVTKCMTVDLENEPILFVSISPGWVQTDMGGPNAPLTAQQSIRDLLETFTRLNEQHNGGLFRRDGTPIPF